MMRALVIAFAVLLLAVAAWNLVAHFDLWQASILPAFFGVMILLTVFFEPRYRGGQKGAPTGQPTGERFIDPTTDKLTEVTFDPATGERSYIPVDNAK
jgi:Na+-transporting NADH:ubiquinone oxidoreductase subunit NqrB